MKKCRKNVGVSSNQLTLINRAAKIRNNILVVTFIIAILVILIIVSVKLSKKLNIINKNLNTSMIYYRQVLNLDNRV